MPAAELVELSKIKISKAAQRKMNTKRVLDRILPYFSYKVAKSITVVRREDGSLWCVDGQHTIKVLQEKGYTHWWCLISPSSGEAEEANLFRVVNRNSKLPSPIEDHNIAITGSDPLHIEIEGLLRSWKDCLGIRIKCIRSLEKMVVVYGPGVVDGAVNAIHQTWPLAKSSDYLESLLRGFCYVIGEHPELSLGSDGGNTQRLAKKIARVFQTPRQLVSNALTVHDMIGGGRCVGVAMGIASVWNTGLKKNSIRKMDSTRFTEKTPSYGAVHSFTGVGGAS